MSTSLINIADRVFNRPLFIHPQKAEVIAWVLRDRLGGVEIDEPAPEASRFVGSRKREGRDWALARSTKGVALIPVHGSLVNRGAWLDARSGMTSYEGTVAQIKDAVNDPEVRAIVLDIDSPGGEATGMFNAAAAIREARKSKRIVAVVDDMAASAAFGLASAADEIVISPTSIVGSIGVVMMHLDRSGELAQRGVKATLIYAGAHKVDANPLGPLSPEVAADLRRGVMTFYDRFLETVEAGRGLRTTADMARATEARTYIGQEAIDAGLADRIATLDQVVAELSTNPRPSGRSTQGGLRMEATDKPVAGISQATHDAAVNAARAEGHANGKAEGLTEGKAQGEAAALQRFDAIMALEEAKGREPMAAALFKSGVSADQAKSILSSAPKGAGNLAARMEAEPSVGGPSTRNDPAAGNYGWDDVAAKINKEGSR